MRPIVLLSIIALLIVSLSGCTSTTSQPLVVGPALIFFYTDG